MRWDRAQASGSTFTISLLDASNTTVDSFTYVGSTPNVSYEVPVPGLPLVSHTGPVGFTPGLQFDGSGFVAPIPEPETYAMLLAGLGLLGWRIRARKVTKG